jgi:hypothetical protein
MLRVLSLLPALLAAAPAHAAPARVAVARVTVIGSDVPAELQRSLQGSLAGGILAAGVDLVPEGELTQALTGAPGLDGCETATCSQRLAELVNAQAVAKARVEVVGSNFTFNLDLFDRRGRALAHVTDSCSVCNDQEANEALSRAGRVLGQRLSGFTPEPVPATPAPPPKKTPLYRRWPLWVGVGLGAAAVVGIAVGVSLGTSGTNFRNTAAASCVTSNCLVVDLRP